MQFRMEGGRKVIGTLQDLCTCCDLQYYRLQLKVWLLSKSWLSSLGGVQPSGTTQKTSLRTLVSADCLWDCAIIWKQSGVEPYPLASLLPR